MREERKISLRGLTFVLLATACWSTSGIFINVIKDSSGISPVALAFWRDSTAFLCLLMGLSIFRRDLLIVDRRDLPYLVAMGGISIGLFHVLYNTAVTTIGVSVSTVIQANSPIFVTAIAWLLWKEPLTPRKIVAILMAVLGTVLISSLYDLSRYEITFFGLLVALSTAVTYGSFSIFGKKLGGKYNSWTILTYVFGFAALLLLPFQTGSRLSISISPRMLGGFTALILLATISGFGLYTAGLQRLEAGIASIIANTEVPLAAIFSYMILGERLDVYQILGAALIVGGVILLSLPVESKK